MQVRKINKLGQCGRKWSVILQTLGPALTTSPSPAIVFGRESPGQDWVRCLIFCNKKSKVTFRHNSTYHIYQSTAEETTTTTVNRIWKAVVTEVHWHFKDFLQATPLVLK